MDISTLELWQLWKLRYEQLALLMLTQQNLAASEREAIIYAGAEDRF